jgi:hypothetical protein
VSRRTTATIGVMSLVLVLVHSLLWDAVRWDGDRLVARMSDLVHVGEDKASLFRLSLVADMVGSYLLLIPLALHLRSVHRDQPLVDLATVAALVYGVAGALTAAALAIGGESLIRDHAGALGAERAAAASSFRVLMDAALGSWQLLCLSAAGCWWLVMGRALQSDHRWLGLFTMAMALVSLAVATGRAFGLDYEIGGPATLAFAPIGIWAAWVGLATSAKKVT